MQAKNDPETVADAMRDLTCAAALLDAAMMTLATVAERA